MLRIGTTGDYAPYTLSDADQHRLGADVEMARQIALSLGLRPEFITTSWATLLDDARAGRFDIAVGGISITPERQAVVAFTRPYSRDAKRPVVRCGMQSQYDTLAEIDTAGVRVIVNRGGTNESFARRHFAHAALAVHGDNRTVFDEIIAGRADVMVTDGVEARLQQARGLGLCAVERAGWEPAGKAILVQKDTRLRAAVERALRQSGGQPAQARRLERWIDSVAHPAEAQAARMAALIDERLALVIEVARYKWNAGAAIEDPPREQALLAAMRLKGGQLGIAQGRVEAFFQAQMDAARQLQRELFRRWKHERRERFPGVQELATELRPQIDAVNEQMLQTLQRLDAARTVMLPAASTLYGISPNAVRMARAPLQPSST